MRNNNWNGVIRLPDQDSAPKERQGEVRPQPEVRPDAEPARETKPGPVQTPPPVQLAPEARPEPVQTPAPAQPAPPKKRVLPPPIEKTVAAEEQNPPAGGPSGRGLPEGLSVPPSVRSGSDEEKFPQPQGEGGGGISVNVRAYRRLRNVRINGGMDISSPLNIFFLVLTIAALVAAAVFWDAVMLAFFRVSVFIIVNLAGVLLLGAAIAVLVFIWRRRLIQRLMR